MEIGSIELGCKSASHFNISEQISSFVLFHTPAVIIVNGKEYSLNGSSAVIFTPGSRRSFRPAYHTPPKYDLIELRLSSSDKQYLSSIGLPHDVPIEIPDDYVISSLIKCMKEQSVRSKTTAGEFMELTMRAVFSAVCEELKAAGHRKNTPEISHIDELKALRESVYESPMSQWMAMECANDMGISRAYFHRLYFSAFGVTFLHDIIESRLMYASELLETTELSVNTIAEKCGYESDSYFMRQFKKYRGCTPTEYRKSK